MKRIGLALAAVSLAASATACSKDGGPFLAPVVPLAYVRLLSAVPDTGATDWRFIDGVANSPFALGQPFRSFTAYMAATPGPRHLRIFPTSAAINVTSQIIQDVTLTFEAGKYYTVVWVGLARAPSGDPNADKVVVFEDTPPTIPASSIVLRAINLGAGATATTGLNTGAPATVDVYSATATGDAQPGTVLFSNVAYLQPTAYVTRATGGLALRAFPSGSTTPLLANILAQDGVPADPALSGSAIGGAKQAGSAITAYIFSRTTVGSAAGQTGANTTPQIVYLVDRRPQ